MANRNYELMFVLNPELSDEGKQTLLERVRGYLERAKAQNVTLTDWGIRRLTYRIKGQQEGQYYLAQFVAEPSGVNELERNVLLTDGIIRHMLALSPEPSAKASQAKSTTELPLPEFDDDTPIPNENPDSTD